MFIGNYLAFRDIIECFNTYTISSSTHGIVCLSFSNSDQNPVIYVLYSPQRHLPPHLFIPF